MSAAGVSADLVAALEAAANAALEGPTTLVSVEITVLAPGAGRIEAQLVRRTRTLAFMAAACVDADGQRLATAASVHRPI